MFILSLSRCAAEEQKRSGYSLILGPIAAYIEQKG